jgi:hypothetical protein
MSKNFLKIGFGLLAGGFLAGAALPALALPAGTPPKNASGLRGEAAITALGTNLNSVAAQHRKTPAALQALLRSDSSLRVNAAGKLFYVCEGLALPPTATNNAAAAAVAQPIFPLSETFLLHSKRGSARTIYLDFDGHTISGTRWNDDFNGGRDIIAPPWDIDGNPAAFGAIEQASIQEVWFRVAEDYAAFDVDVTTEFPGEDAMLRTNLSDQIFGTRALISPIAAQIVPAGGVAYLGVFNEVGNYHKPALVFPENLGNDPKNIAEATSHEVGHNLDLSHDGTTVGQAYYDGQGNWAPIMGVGYYKPIVQWSKGEYANANNLEDDLAVITSTGLDYRTNDFGSSIGTAASTRPPTASFPAPMRWISWASPPAPARPPLI